MQTRVDRFGRVVIPKTVRDHMGLQAGKVLDVEEQEGRVILQPVQEKSPLIQEKGLLVHTGEFLEPVENAVEKSRDDRIRKTLRFDQP